MVMMVMVRALQIIGTTIQTLISKMEKNLGNKQTMQIYLKNIAWEIKYINKCIIKI